MKLVAFLLSLALCAPHAADAEELERHLRRSTKAGGNIVKDQRWLQTSDSVPFMVTVKISKGSDKMDLVPTAADYDAAMSSVVDWFDHGSQALYANATDLSYVETTCMQNGTAASTDDRFQHELSLNCLATFNSFQEANSTTSSIPSSVKLVQDATLSYPIQNYIRGYFAPAMPEGSAFQHARLVLLSLMFELPPGYSMTTIAPMDPANNGTMFQPEDYHEGHDFMITAPPGGFSSSTTTTPNNAGNLLTEVPMVLQWTMGAPSDIREPTYDEWRAFVDDTQAFLTAAFTNAFPTTFQSVYFAKFLGTGPILHSEEPYTVDVDYVASFRVAEGTTAPPTWMAALQDAELEDFLTDFVATRPGVFQSVLYVRWEVLEPESAVSRREGPF